MGAFFKGTTCSNVIKYFYALPERTILNSDNKHLFSSFLILFYRSNQVKLKHSLIFAPGFRKLATVLFALLLTMYIPEHS